jgi:penicillin-binding protein 2
VIEPKAPEDRLPPMTPKLALRVAIIGSCALAMFAIIFFRLWYLQVLSGSQYRNAASVNAERPIPVQPPRGEILDADGNVLVGSEPVPAAELSAPDLPVPITEASMAADRDRPPAKDARLYDSLAKLLGMSTKPELCIVDGKYPPPRGTLETKRAGLMLSPIGCLVAQGVASVPYDNITIDTDVSPDVHAYLAERSSRFPGVIVQKDYLTTYPLNDEAAQLLGTVGPISCDDPKVNADCELHQKHFKGVPETMTVGQSGLEYEYDQYLRGEEGSQAIKVNALGQFEGYGPETAPTAGENLQVSINTRLQEVGQNALQTSIDDNGGAGGAFVAMDPVNGQLYAMGSNPTFNPNIFTHPLTQAQYDQDFGAGSGDPLVNRAIQSAGPTGSTFKVITATAALESGDWALDGIYDDTGQFCLSGECRRNSGGAAYGDVNLVDAIRVSDDNFFYNLGALMNSPAPQGGPLQAWAKAFGIGRQTGIDLPGAAAGTRPTPAWRARVNTLEARCMAANKDNVALCPYAIWPTEPWTEGDNVNMAVGQGDVQVSPLQLAVVYSALANGGTIVTPHLGEDIQSSTGTILQKIDPGPRRKLDLNQTDLDTILEGLRQAASAPGGTSADVMGDFPEQVYGKTGTAQYFNSEGVETDYAWYATFVPSSATGKPIVVVVWVEKGGFGDVAAAPVARQILSQWFLGTPGPYKSGTSDTL